MSHDSCGTNASDKLDAAYFDCLPPLEEISDISEPIISEKSFLDYSASDISDIPDLEEMPDMTELPSFLGTNYESRQNPRALRSSRVL